mgnify:CR=1 FL=1
MLVECGPKDTAPRRGSPRRTTNARMMATVLDPHHHGVMAHPPGSSSTSKVATTTSTEAMWMPRVAISTHKGGTTIPKTSVGVTRRRMERIFQTALRHSAAVVPEGVSFVHSLAHTLSVQLFLLIRRHFCSLFFCIRSSLSSKSVSHVSTIPACFEAGGVVCFSCRGQDELRVVYSTPQGV